jgi:hypothetical protein
MLRTGDIMLFESSRWFLFDWVIRFFTRSAFTHVGMVLVDPPFGVPRGTYLWESGFEPVPDPQDGMVKLGVRLTPIESIDVSRSRVYVRACLRVVADVDLDAIHHDVYLKPYDLCACDWLLAIARVDAEPRKTSRFWCSAFVAYVIVRLGLMPQAADWSIARPCDLSSTTTAAPWSAIDAAYAPDRPFSFSGTGLKPP